MRSQDISLLQTVTDALSSLSTQGDSVGVQIMSVTTKFPDGSVVIFNKNTETPETDWYITAVQQGA